MKRPSRLRDGERAASAALVFLPFVFLLQNRCVLGVFVVVSSPWQAHGRPPTRAGGRGPAR
ncbi:MAG: hypothetical protein WBR18_13140, partial [Anaerolineales bacterium]